MPRFRPMFVLSLALTGCASSGGQAADSVGTAVLAFTDANVIAVSGGYADVAIPVAPGVDVCFDTSGVDWAIESVQVFRLGMGEPGLRCALGRDSLNQADFTGGLYTSVPGPERSCLSEMEVYPEGLVLTCEPGTAWAVIVWGVDDSRAYRILDPCAEAGATEVVIDASAPSFTDVVADVQAATPLSVETGVQYTLEWSGVSVDAFGAPVDPTDLRDAVVADVMEGVQLADAALSPEENADAFYDLRWHDGGTERDLAEEYGGPGFTGFEASHRYLVGFSPPSDCIQASVIAAVDVVE